MSSALNKEKTESKLWSLFWHCKVRNYQETVCIFNAHAGVCKVSVCFLKLVHVSNLLYLNFSQHFTCPGRKLQPPTLTFKALNVAKRRKMFFEEDSNFTRGNSARENSWQTEFDNNF